MNSKPHKRKPRRGAPTKGEPSARERILSTAVDLFYREGIQPTGVDTVAARSGISKTSLYRAFASKDELICAVVEQQDRRYWAWWDEVVAHQPDARGQLRDLLRKIAARITGPAFRGCPFLNTAIEFPDRAHPGRELTRANKAELHKRLADLCKRMGVKNPARLAARVALLIDGAYVSGLVVDTAHLETDLVEAAFALIDRELSR
jgi:AcrR family transcriptional regulator